MQEAIIFKRRNRLKNQFVNTSLILLYGYQDGKRKLSDGAKQTYQVMDSMDWEDKDTGDSKGYVFPAIETIAQRRGKKPRAIYNHIDELIQVGLLTRQRRKNKSSLLYIEDVADAEAQRYLARYVTKPPSGMPTPVASTQSAIAKKCISPLPEELQKSANAIQEADEFLKEKENNVNADQRNSTGEMASLKGILARYQLRPLPARGKPNGMAERDYLAQEMADQLGDRQSLGCFRMIAEKIPQAVIFEMLSRVKETARAQRIRQSRGALFVEIIKQYAQSRGLELGFRQEAKE